MQFVLTLDWVSIVASIVALLSLIASIFSALGAARSADVAKTAERRIASAERKSVERELLRTAASVELEARLTIAALEDASRTAVINAGNRASPDKKLPFLQANAEFQSWIEKAKAVANHGVTVEMAGSESDEWIAKQQLGLDKALTLLRGDTAMAAKRSEQMTYTNRSDAEAVIAAERSQGIHVQTNHEGKLV